MEVCSSNYSKSKCKLKRNWGNPNGLVSCGVLPNPGELVFLGAKPTRIVLKDLRVALLDLRVAPLDLRVALLDRRRCGLVSDRVLLNSGGLASLGGKPTTTVMLRFALWIKCRRENGSWQR